ncbi:PapD-like protein [Coprinopsis sp. MPI-PUGE-AT-0042]|nr:PapD-like protein [Coprinopsis sp. MPI-PUGE-AT-0042]
MSKVQNRRAGSSGQVNGPFGVTFAGVSQGEISRTDKDSHVASQASTTTTAGHLSFLIPPAHRFKMSVSLTPPNTLGFRRPLTQLVKRSLTITNNNSLPVAFKVKTTAPKLYCVRPNSGRVEPGESLEVAVMLQAMKDEPPLNSKCKDKFLIQSTIITPDKETMSLQDIWASTDANEEGKVHQQKLRVTYLPAEGQTLEEEDETAANQSSFINPSDVAFDTVKQQPAANGHHPIPTFSVTDSGAEEPQRQSTPPAVDYSEVSEDEQPQAPATREPPPPPPPAVVPEVVRAPSAPQPSAPEPQPVPEQQPQSAPEPIVITKENPINEELMADNQDLRAQLERLKQELSILEKETLNHTNELRQRRRDSDANSADETVVATAVEEPVHSIQQDGVPLNVVVLISFTVFFMTYIFF